MIDVESFPTAQAAADALSGQSKYLAGGTLLMRQVNYGDQSFNKLVYTKDTAMRNIHSDGTRMHLGAGCTMKDILDSNELAFLANVARSIGGPAIRNMATVGGNLFATRPYGDFATALLALDATLHWSGGREQKLEDFLKQNQTGNGIVTSISFNKPNTQDFKYLKVSRVKPKGVSVMTLAAFIQLDIGRVGSVRLAFGGMGPVPARAIATEKTLAGVSLDERGIQRALETVNSDFTPADDALASAWYRTQVAPVHLSRLLLQRSQY